MTSPHPERWRCTIAASPAATADLGRRIGRQLRAGDTVALVGDLGAGKTTLARGIAQGLAIDDADAVASPTYLLVVEHDGPIRLLHADAYLPAKLAGFLDDGGLEYLFQPGVVTLLEWADRVAAAVPAAALWVQLAVASTGGRTLSFACARVEDFPWLPGLGENPRRD